MYLTETECTVDSNPQDGVVYRSIEKTLISLPKILASEKSRMCLNRLSISTDGRYENVGPRSDRLSGSQAKQFMS